MCHKNPDPFPVAANTSLSSFSFFPDAAANSSFCASQSVKGDERGVIILLHPPFVGLQSAHGLRARRVWETKPRAQNSKLKTQRASWLLVCNKVIKIKYFFGLRISITFDFSTLEYPLHFLRRVQQLKPYIHYIPVWPIQPLFVDYANQRRAATRTNYDWVSSMISEIRPLWSFHPILCSFHLLGRFLERLQNKKK